MSSKVYFDEVAGQWDDMRSGFFSEAIREKAYDKAKVESGRTAADLGAGTGFVSEGLLKRGLNVIAIDQSQAMLDMINEKFSSVGTITCRLGESAALPIESASVEYAFANMYLHHVEDPETAISEMARILKPGGKLVITDLDQHNHDFLRTEHHDRWNGFKRQDVEKWFRNAGLKNITVDCAGGNCCAESSCGSSSARINIFIAYGEKD